MDFRDFKGSAKRVDQIDIAIMAHRIGVHEDVMQAVREVEAARSGFDSQGRPKMLFEPHVFYRNLSGSERDEAMAAGLAYPEWRRNYPKDSYPRLQQAMQINLTAALRSASWGAGQILGENHIAAGYSTVEEMVWAFMEDEEAHYEGMVGFILHNRLDDDLRRLDWRGFARGYNGPAYAANRYHEKLAEAYARWQRVADAQAPIFADPESAGLPNGPQMREVQLRLRSLGYFETGKADGEWGFKTRAGLLAFRADNDMPLVAKIDDQFLAAIAKASPRPTGMARATTTVADLRAEGSETIARADAADNVGKIAIGGGGLLGGLEIFDAISERTDGLVERVQPVLDLVQTNMPIVLIAGGAFIVYQMWQTKQRRLQDHREGKHVGR